MDGVNGITQETIQQAFEKLKNVGVIPTKLYMSRAVAMAIMKEFGDSVVKKGKNGKDYIWGAEVMPDNRLDDDTIYIM